VEKNRMNPEFWRDRKVFLTGHTGFKGSWLTLWLLRLGARVCGYALEPPTDPSLFELANIGDGIQSVLGDVRDRDRLRAEVLRVQPEVVLHLAAQSVVLHSYDDPIETYATNVVGTACVLDAVRQMRRSCIVVNVTTDKVYENRRWAWGYRENDQLGGRDPYSSSKACAELVARAFRESYFFAEGAASSRVGLANARAGNVIGGGDWTARQLIPEAVAAMLAGEPVVLRHPAAIRPWQHVLDCLCGYLTLAEALARDATRYSDDWNFGPSDADMQPVARVVEILAEHWGWKEPWVQSAGSYAHEEMDLRLNSQKANRELHWTPRLPLPDALAWTAEWYRRHAQGASARDLCIEQIERYAARVS
jgi:CDP-glucose 4,6-dehydratase